MDKKQLDNLFDRYLEGSLTRAELELLMLHFQLEEVQLSERIVTELSKEHPVSKTDKASIEKIRYRLLETIAAEPKNRWLWPKMLAAAVTLFVLVGGGAFYYYQAGEKANLLTLKPAQDIHPGKQTATLTLADGSRLHLSEVRDGRVATQGGTTVLKDTSGRLIYRPGQSSQIRSYNTLSTAMGETYQLQLPDGSQVWLNANSTLRYPVAFEGEERLVELTGEGYFEVVHNRQQPFRVRSAGQIIEDIGTRFNVKSYSDEPAAETTLMEGSVSVRAGNQMIILRPGQQAVSSGRAIHVANIDTGAVMDWKEGRFYLYHLDFKKAMRKIARWYDLRVVFDQDMPADIRSWGSIPRTASLSAVLRAIEASGQVHFRLDGRTIYVSR